ncbi:nitroreductase [Dehalobacterium formicoaceticum]|uniref:nitroreductase n=1 Tax=Dehalobacterium formicoaceticum TaxID=51515 RepID=UPI000B7DF99E|nr:nitroreductase [Dehalobacterium formicoaceticum]
MDVIEALQTRRSFRAYKPDTVDQDTIRKIVEAANHAPSWANTQPWEFYVASGQPLENLRRRCVENFRNGVAMEPDIPFAKEWPEAHKSRTFKMGAARFETLGIDRDDQEGRTKLTENNFRFFGAPVMIFPCMDRNLPQWSLYDMGAVSQSIMLAAQHYGLNTVTAIMMAAYPQIIREELKVPDELSIVIGIALGYGDAESVQNNYVTERRPLNEILHIQG